MATRLKYWLGFPSMLRSALLNIRLAVRLLRDPHVPLFLKILPLAGLAYVVSPLDFVPDVLPVVGQIDDLGFIVLAIELFKHLSPRQAVTHHESEIAQGRRYSPAASAASAPDIIDAQFRRD